MKLAADCHAPGTVEHIGLLNALFVVLGLVVMAGLASPAAREQNPRR